MTRKHVSWKSLSIYIGIMLTTLILGLLLDLSILAILSLIIFVTTIFLIATEILMRSTAALLGAFLIFAVFSSVGYHSVEIAHKFIEINTILTLFGIIIVASLGLKSGLFYFIGMKVAKISRGDPLLLYFIFAVLTLVLNIFLIAVATIIVVVSLTLTVCDLLKIDPRPYVLMEIFTVNVAASSTMISSVPNIIIAEKAHLSYAFFVKNLVLFVIIFFLLSLWMLFIIFPPPTVVDVRRALAILEIDEWLFVKSKSEFYVSAICMSGLIIGFIMSRDLMVISLLFAVIALIFYSSPEELIHDVDWDTLLFFIGFYVIIAGLSLTGILDGIAMALIMLSGGSLYILLTLLFWISVIISGFVDNIPYVLVIIPIIERLVRIDPFSQYSAIFWIFLILACNVGGGLNPYSAPQNLLALSMSKKGGYPILTRDYYKVSIKWTALGGSLAYVYGMLFIVTPIIVEKIGHFTFMAILILIILGGILIGLHKTVGISRFIGLVKRMSLFIKRTVQKTMKR